VEKFPCNAEYRKRGYLSIDLLWIGNTVLQGVFFIDGETLSRCRFW